MLRAPACSHSQSTSASVYCTLASWPVNKVALSPVHEAGAVLDSDVPHHVLLSSGVRVRALGGQRGSSQKQVVPESYLGRFCVGDVEWGDENVSLENTERVATTAGEGALVLHKRA